MFLYTFYTSKDRKWGLKDYRLSVDVKSLGHDFDVMGDFFAEKRQLLAALLMHSNVV